MCTFSWNVRNCIFNRWFFHRRQHFLRISRNYHLLIFTEDSEFRGSRRNLPRIFVECIIYEHMQSHSTYHWTLSCFIRLLLSEVTAYCMLHGFLTSHPLTHSWCDKYAYHQVDTSTGRRIRVHCIYVFTKCNCMLKCLDSSSFSHCQHRWCW